MKEQIDIDEAVEQIFQVVEEAEPGDLLDLYKHICNPTAKLIRLNNGEFTIEYTNATS